MEIEQSRTEMRRRFEDAQPAFSSKVMSEDEYESYCIRPYRVINRADIPVFEKIEQELLCRLCITEDKATGRLLCYRVCCSLEDNLIENDPKSIVHLQCFHCGFDMLFPYVPPVNQADLAQQDPPPYPIPGSAMNPDPAPRTASEIEALQRHYRESQLRSVAGVASPLPDPVPPWYEQAKVLGLSMSEILSLDGRNRRAPTKKG